MFQRFVALIANQKTYFDLFRAYAGKEAVDAFLEALELFALGYSWGGYESLILPTARGIIRTATSWQPAGPSLRIHAGLETPEDLIADLEQAFIHLREKA